MSDEKNHPSPDCLLTPGFRAIVASQACSLLGLEILQFVLPLHLLNLTGSGALYGGVLAAGFVPYVALSPVGGILADRTRKRGVMVACDAALALVMALYLATASPRSVVPVTVAVLMVAFAAQALYHPCVQSAVPLVVAPGRITASSDGLPAWRCRSSPFPGPPRSWHSSSGFPTSRPSGPPARSPPRQPTSARPSASFARARSCGAPSLRRCS